MQIAVLMTCYNRADTTLSCLHRLFDARLPVEASFDVWLNDDGCTDGTGERCHEFFEEQKACGWRGEGHVIHGSGHDFWCGGMRRMWAAASESGADYDGYLWLNDDTFLLENAFEIFFGNPNHADSILVGAISSRDGKTATYGGADERGFVVPNRTWQPIRQMNGNVVWVPRTVFARLGNLDRHWTHAMGDGDYSRTAVEQGIRVLLSPVFIGTCERNEGKEHWRDPSVPLIRRLKSLYSPLGYGEPQNLFRYCLKHDGLLVAVRNWLSCHLQVLFPRLRGGRNGRRS